MTVYDIEDIPDCKIRGMFGDCHEDSHLRECMHLVLSGKCPLKKVKGQRGFP